MDPNTKHLVRQATRCIVVSQDPVVINTGKQARTDVQQAARSCTDFVLEVRAAWARHAVAG